MTKFKIGEKAKIKETGEIVEINSILPGWATYPYMVRVEKGLGEYFRYFNDEELEKVEEWTLNNLPKKVKCIKENDSFLLGEVYKRGFNVFYNGKNLSCTQDIIYLGLLAGVLEPVNEEDDKVEEFIEKFKKGVNYSEGCVVKWLSENLKDKIK